MVLQTHPTELPATEGMEPKDPGSLFAMAVESVNKACDVLGRRRT